MFPSLLFPPGLFPFGLYPGAGKAISSDNFLAALDAYAQVQLVASGLATWAGTGRAPAQVKLPYVKIGTFDEDADYQEDGSGHAPYDDIGMLPVLCLAAQEDAANALSRSVSKIFTGAPLVFGDGTLLLCRRTNRGSAVFDADPAPGGQGCWVAHLMFATIISKNL